MSDQCQDAIHAARDMLERWSTMEYECRCDSRSGVVCEWCHNTQVVRDLVRVASNYLDQIGTSEVSDGE
jgi:hypothetical protein